MATRQELLLLFQAVTEAKRVADGAGLHFISYLLMMALMETDQTETNDEKELQ